MQVLFVHGGEAFEDKEELYNYLRTKEYNPREKFKKWKDNFPEKLDCECFFPSMPNKQMADYEAWKIWFERHFEFLTDDRIVLCGGSLGGIFLAKYLSENKFPKPVAQLHLIAAPFGDIVETGERVNSFTFDSKNLKNIEAGKIFLYHSKDDSVVPYTHVLEFMKYLDAELVTFEDRGHFQVEEFPELLANIKNA